jgi:HK97 family phage major capsid protein
MGTITTPAPTKSLGVKVSTKAVEGERTILAVVSSSNLDRDYERVDVKSLRLPLKGGGYVVAKDLTGQERLDIPMLINHSFDVEDTIGSVRKAYLNEAQELVVEFGISKRARAQELLTLIEEEHLDNAFSLTMSDYEYSDSTIYDAEVVEISLVFRGSNKDARVLQVKSLIKGDSMATAKELTVEQKKAEIERLQKELEVEEPTEDKPVEETPAPEADKVVEQPEEDPKPEEDKELPENVETKSTKKETKKMADQEIAVKQVKDVPEVEVVTKKETPATKKQIRELFVKQFVAYKTKNTALLQELNKKAMELDGVKSKAIGYDDASALYQAEVVSTDILTEYTNVGRLGALVNKVDILGATQWKRIVQASGNGFQPVGIEESKPEDKPSWTPLTVLPKEHALIVAWYDAIARETPIAVYQQIIRYIADEYAKLEDKIVLSFAGATTTGGDTFAATGVMPILLTDGTRTVNVATFSAADTQAGFGRAYGMVESDKPLTIVANRKTWGRVATTVDADGRNVFTVVGQQVSAGALGTFNVVISEEATDGVLVMGAFADYDLVTRGGLETLFSREATVGSLNLFTDDASAVRANCDIAGKPTRVKSFVLIDFVPAVS